MLSVARLRAGYGATPVLHGVSFDVHAGEIVALLGRNGAGRSTTARALMGLLPAQGERHWRGQSLAGLPPHRIARLGLGYVPEGRDIFTRLSVEQNLRLGLKPGGVWRRARHTPATGAAAWTLDTAYQQFPALAARRHAPASVLSGGEQQMLALARTLLGQPQLLIVDEPTEGLAPQITAQLATLLQALRAQGLGVLLIEQKQSLALAIADRVLVMGRGQIVFAGTPEELRANADVQRAWLAV